MTEPGKIILLNGSSSAGKTTLAITLQQVLAEPYHHIALDQFRDGIAGRYRGLNSPEGTPGARGLNVVPIEFDGQVLTEVQFGDLGRQTLRGMRRAIAAFAREGNNVIIDDLMFELEFLKDYLEVLEGFDVLFVGVRCDIETVNVREGLRPGRFPGTATTHFDKVHAHAQYDLEVDAGRESPHACAQRVAEYLRKNGSGRAFDALRQAL